ncbi:MAG TPA: CAP domain-containing protein [Anaerolineae bacterium]|nr:CAP domain-containing protein [Anaerolineae bacterium]
MLTKHGYVSIAVRAIAVLSAFALIAACQTAPPEPTGEAPQTQTPGERLEVRTTSRLISLFSNGDWSAEVQLEVTNGQPPFTYETTWPRLGSDEPATFSVSGSNCEPIVFTAMVTSSDGLERKVQIGIGPVSCEGVTAASPEPSPGAAPPTPSETTTPATTGTPPVTSPPSASLDAATQELLRLINDLRVRNNAPEFAYNDKLAQAAVRHSQNMASTGQISLQVTGEPDLAQRVQEAGYTGQSTEIIYAGGADPIDALDWWLTDQTDPGHRTNIIGTEFQEIGIGIVKGAVLTYYTLVFGKP